MAVPNSAETQRLRDSFAAWRTESCQIQRPTRTQTTSGGYSDAYTTVTTVQCRRTPDLIPPVERDAGPATRAIGRWWVSFAAGTTIRPTDRLVIGGRTYEVIDAQDRTLEIQRRVLVQEIS